MSSQSEEVQGILLNADMINYEVKSRPDYDITDVAKRYFDLAESYINKTG
jgi:hypothetical protein